MRTLILLTAVLMLGGGGCLHGEPASPIRLNTVGYLPDAPKRASTVLTDGRFSVVRVEDGASVWSGAATTSVVHTDTDETLAVVDFSSVRAPGLYRVRHDSGAVSPEFRIDPAVYVEPYRLVTRAMYLWRCGQAVSGEWQGHHFRQDACHLDDAWLDQATGERRRQPSIGGWHDAGDYNKYVVNAGITVGAMLRAWEDFPALRAHSLGLPEAGGPLPEFLAEIKHETDWLLTMQDEQGRVFTKVSTLSFGGFVPPHQEKDRRYFAPWGTPATADFTAMLAQAARAFAPYDAAYAARCEAAAARSYAFLARHPEHQEPDQAAFKTGGYKTKDDDDRLWAAVELWETTGDPAALRDAEQRLRAQQPTFAENFDWGDVKNLGLFTYLRSDRAGRDEELVAALRANLRSVADGIVAVAQAHGYARPLGARYYWGGNGGVARQALLLAAADRVSPKPEYRETALDAVNHLLGRNVHGRSYVTGLGHRPPQHPHDRRSGGDDVAAPWPGYLVGGPNPRARDWFDQEGDYRTNEIAINWNGALIYALAMMLPEQAE